MIQAAYKIHWTEYERGWGSRPDGTQVFKTKELAEQKIKEFFAKRKNDGHVPDEYSNPSDPILFEITPEIAKRLEREDSFWLHMSQNV